MFKAISNEYLANGVIITPTNPSPNDNVSIVYNGLLAQSGAQDVYARVGYGCEWQGSQDIKMIRTNSGFEATIPVANSDALNVAFKDSADNWDNNTSMNYRFNIRQ